MSRSVTAVRSDGTPVPAGRAPGRWEVVRPPMDGEGEALLVLSGTAEEAVLAAGLGFPDGDLLVVLVPEPGPAYGARDVADAAALGRLLGPELLLRRERGLWSAEVPGAVSSGWRGAPGAAAQEAVRTLLHGRASETEARLAAETRLVELRRVVAARREGSDVGEGRHALGVLLDRVVAGWPIDRRAYPLLPADPAERRAAASGHVTAHLSKQAGKLSALFEPLLHGRAAPDPLEVARQVAYAVVDALRLVPLGGTSSAAVADALASWESEQTVRGPELTASAADTERMLSALRGPPRTVRHRAVTLGSRDGPYDVAACSAFRRTVSGDVLVDGSDYDCPDCVRFDRARGEPSPCAAGCAEEDHARGEHTPAVRAECQLPPPGWRCTRGFHADGPCAAVPDARPKEPTWERGESDCSHGAEEGVLHGAASAARYLYDVMDPSRAWDPEVGLARDALGSWLSRIPGGRPLGEAPARGEAGPVLSVDMTGVDPADAARFADEFRAAWRVRGARRAREARLSASPRPAGPRGDALEEWCEASRAYRASVEYDSAADDRLKAAEEGLLDAVEAGAELTRRAAVLDAAAVAFADVLRDYDTRTDTYAELVLRARAELDRRLSRK